MWLCELIKIGSFEIPEGTAGFVEAVVLGELHVKPIVDGEGIGVFALALGYLMVPQGGQIEHLLFFYSDVVGLGLLKPLESLPVVLRIGVDADPTVLIAGGFAGELALLVVPPSRFVLLFLKSEDGVGRHEREVFFTDDGRVEVLVGVFVHG
jgi:hypothetical protein